MHVILHGKDEGIIADILKDDDLPLYDALVKQAEDMFTAYDLQLITISSTELGQPKAVTTIFDKMNACRDALIAYVDEVRDPRERAMCVGLGNQIGHLIAYWDLRGGKVNDKAFDSSD